MAITTIFDAFPNKNMHVRSDALFDMSMYLAPLGHPFVAVA